VLDAAGQDSAQEVALIRLVRGRLTGRLPDTAVRLAEQTVSERDEYGSTTEWFPFLWTTAVDWLIEAGTPEDVEAARRAVDIVASGSGRRQPALEAELLRLRATLALTDPAAADLEAVERDLRQAIRALDAYGAEPDRARAQALLGRLLREHGRADEARGLLAEAGETFARIGAGERLLRLASAA
jgi:hypothetical protein